MKHITGLKCLICGETYAPGQVQYVCPQHGNDGNLDVQYDYDYLRNRAASALLDAGSGMWRYKPLLPLEIHAKVPPLLVGATPLYPAPDLAGRLALGGLRFKDDGRNPTASLKDRASALVVARALAEGQSVVTTASTGNAAAALAGLAASVQMTSIIFVPATAPEAKVAQLLVYGAHVLLVDGTYDDAFDLCLAASQRFGWYCRNTGYNPYTVEGKKTVSFEICEQVSGKVGAFTPPDWIVVSVGDGNIIGGVYKGLKDLLSLGWIDRMPRLLGVQAEGSAALHHVWKTGTDPVIIKPIIATTIADSISTGLPRDRVRAIHAVNETHGAFVTVSDEEILVAIPALARGTGIFAEPAASAAYAGLLRAVEDKIISSGELVVVLITGNGLKDVISARRAVTSPRKVAPVMEDIATAVDEIFGRSVDKIR